MSFGEKPDSENLIKENKSEMKLFKEPENEPFFLDLKSRMKSSIRTEVQKQPEYKI
jgi:hypothetical protein